jgi:hypothetical protein
MILVLHPNRIFIRCKDRHWRKHPLFGSMPYCAREYKTLVGAQRTARAIGGHVVYIPPGHRLEYTGAVIGPFAVGRITDYISYSYSS